MSLSAMHCGGSISSSSPSMSLSHTNNIKHKSAYMIVMMAKSKKRRSSSSSPQGSEPPALRITSNVKQSLQVVKLWKGFRDRKSTIPRTSYRRKREPKEDLPEDIESNDNLESCRDPAVTFGNKKKVRYTGDPVVLVDGYNVCGYWPKLRKHFFAGQLQMARDMLIDELITFSSVREEKVVVAFDAKNSRHTHKESFAGIDIVYTACADAWIEKEVVALMENGCPQVWVVTSDRLEQEMANGSGALVWSCKTLISEIKASEEEIEMMQKEQRDHSFQGKLLKHNLDSKVVTALKELRDKLKLAENEKRIKR